MFSWKPWWVMPVPALLAFFLARVAFAGQIDSTISPADSADRLKISYASMTDDGAVPMLEATVLKTAPRLSAVATDSRFFTESERSSLIASLSQFSYGGHFFEPSAFGSILTDAEVKPAFQETYGGIYSGFIDLQPRNTFQLKEAGSLD